jgi:hypothetical protein
MVCSIPSSSGSEPIPATPVSWTIGKVLAGNRASIQLRDDMETLPAV